MGLTKRKISKLVEGRHFDKDGLYIEMGGNNGHGSWLLRYQLRGRERWLGLGSLRNFDLDEARKRARVARQKLEDGIDPIDAKRVQRTQQKLEAARSITFAGAAQSYYDDHQMAWSAKHRESFLSSLKTYAYPVLGALPVAAIDTALVLAVIKPHWVERHVTIARVRARIELVLGWATVHGYRAGDNPARWRGHLKEALPSKVKAVVNHPALAYDAVPAFVAQLSKQQGVAARALEFLILTAARTGEVLHARWSEIDVEKKVWTIPALRMKSRREHRVPMTAAMIKLLKSLPREGGDNGLVFLGHRANVPMHKMALPNALAATGQGNITVHGFRSSFRTWAAEHTAYPREIIEVALAHAVGDATEQAYQRGDLLEKRRQLMEAWSTFVTSPVAGGKTGNKVVALRKTGV